jgi:hypothetical protein
MAIERTQNQAPVTVAAAQAPAKPLVTVQAIPRLPSDAAQFQHAQRGTPAGGADSRRDRALGLVEQMLAPPEARSATERWVTPEMDPATQQRRGLRLAADLQDARALPMILPLVSQGGDTAAKAIKTIQALVPFADAATLAGVQQALKAVPTTEAATALAAVDATLTQRQAGVAPQAPSRSGIGVHFLEAARGVGDMAYDMTVGTFKQVKNDPLRFPTQMIAGMGVSLHHAVKHSGGAVVGLVTGGKYGSFGAQMTQELGNAAMWTSGFVKGRKTNMHPEFKSLQEASGHKFVRDLSAWSEFIPAEPVVARRLQKAMNLPDGVTTRLGKVERSAIKNSASFIYGAEVILPGEAKKVAGAVWKEKGTEATSGKLTLGCVDKAAYDMFNNKWTEYSIVSKIDPTAMAETHLAKNLVKDLGLKLPKTAAEAPAFMEALQAKLNEKFPQGYFVKGVADYNTGGNLITNKANFVESLNGYHTEFKPYVAEMAKQFPDADLQPKINGHKYMSGRTLQQIIDNPETVIIQEKMALSKFTNKKLPLNEQPFNEFRVHTVKGKVVPNGSYHRWSDKQTLLQTKNRKAAEAFVQQVMDKMPKEITDKTALSPDVAMLQDGSFKLLEMNAGGDSGFLHPFTSGMPAFRAAHNLSEMVSGRETTMNYITRRAKVSAAVAATGATHQDHARVQENK